MFHSCFWLLDNHTGESGGSPAPVREVSEVGLFLSTAQSSPRVHLSGVGVVPVLPSTSHLPSPHFQFQNMTCRRSRIHASPAVSEPQPVLGVGPYSSLTGAASVLEKGVGSRALGPGWDAVPGDLQELTKLLGVSATGWLPEVISHSANT